MTAAPTMVDKASPFKSVPAFPSQQAFVSDSRQFSCERQASKAMARQTSKEKVLSQRRTLNGRPLPHCGPLQINRWVVLIFYCLYCVFAGPAYINWTPIADILFRAGAFAWLCDDEQSSSSATHTAPITPPPVPCRAGQNAFAGTAADGAPPLVAAGSKIRSMFVLSSLSVTRLGERGPAAATRRLGSVLTTGSVGSCSDETLSNVPMAPNSSSAEVKPAAESSSSSASLVRCANQEVEVNRLFTITAASHFFFSFIGGTLLDTVGPKVTSLVGLSFALVGWILLGAASKEIHSYVAGCLFLGAGIDTTYFPLLSGANLFPGHVSTVKAVFGGAASFSFAVPLVLRAIYFSSSVLITYRTLFFCYAAACLGAAVLIAIFVVPWKPWKSPYRSLLSGERQRSSPLSAACGLATQSSQLPAAAADRAFDIIAVHYSNSSPSSPAAESLAALQEESLHNNSSRGSSSPVTSSPAGRLLDRNYSNSNHILLQSPPTALAANCREGSLTSGPSSNLSDLSASLSPTSQCSRNDNSVVSPASPTTFFHRHLSELAASPKASAASPAHTHVPENSSNTVKGLEDMRTTVYPAASFSFRHCSSSRSRKYPATSPVSLLSSKTPSSFRQDGSRESRRCLSAADKTPAAVFLSVTSGRCITPSTAGAAYAGACEPQTRTTFRGRSAVSDAGEASSARRTFDKSASFCKESETASLFHPVLQRPLGSSVASPRVRAFLDEQEPQRAKGIQGREISLPQQEGLAPFNLISVPCLPIPLWRARPPAAQAQTSSSSSSSGTGYVPSICVLRSLSPSVSLSLYAANPFACSSSEPACSVSTRSPASSSSRGRRRLSTVPVQRPQLVPLPAAPRPRDTLTPSAASFSLSETGKGGGCPSEQYDVERGFDTLRHKFLYPIGPSLLRSASVLRSREHHDKEIREGLRCCFPARELSANFSPRGSTVSAIHTAAPAPHKKQVERFTAGLAIDALASPGFDAKTQQQQNIVQGGGTTHMRILGDDDILVAPAAPDAASAVLLPGAMKETTDTRDSVAHKSSRTHPAMSPESSTPTLHKNVRGVTHPAGANTVFTLFDDGAGAAVNAEGTASDGPASPLPAKHGHRPAAIAADPATRLPDFAIITPKEAVVAAFDNLHPTSTASLSSLDVQATGSFGKLLICFPFTRANPHKRVSKSRHGHWRRFNEKLSSARRDFCSSLFLPIIPFFCVILTGVVFFIPSARHLLPSAYAANRIIQIFSFLPCPLFGHIADVCGIMPVMYICNFCGLLSFAFVMIPHIPAAVPLQYMASLLAASQLSFLVCQICCYVAETFEEENQGKLIGSLCCIAGLTSLSAHYIMDYAVHHGFFKPLVIFVAALAFNFLLLAFVHWRKRRTGRLLTPGRIFRSQESVDATAASAAAQRLRSLPLFCTMSAAAEAASPSLSPLGVQPSRTAEATAEAPLAEGSRRAGVASNDARGHFEIAAGGSAAVAITGATGASAADDVAPATTVADATAASGAALSANDTAAIADDAAAREKRKDLTRRMRG